MKHFKTTVAFGTLALGSIMGSTTAFAQSSEPYLGEIMNFGGNFCPRGWAAASGQILSIAQNTALFALLGTTYGGNGQTTFALPDLRGRTPIGFGQLPGGQSYTLGQVGGQESTTLISSQMPTHTHSIAVRVSSAAGTVETGVRNTLAAATQNKFYDGATPANNMDVSTIDVGQTGGSQPFSIQSPYLATQFCIALEGIFPSRN